MNRLWSICTMDYHSTIKSHNLDQPQKQSANCRGVGGGVKKKKHHTQNWHIRPSFYDILEKAKLEPK